ncbi:hypothetical protein BH23BAC1_BH23BAC1_25210 [soil metagenome]
MKLVDKNIEIISAPSILGLKPSGVEFLSDSLLASGLAENLQAENKMVHVPTLNSLYSEKRDQYNCLNIEAIKEFSITLGKFVKNTIHKNLFLLFWVEIAVSILVLCQH